jgi:phosphatidylserine decarboxylase precursor
MNDLKRIIRISYILIILILISTIIPVGLVFSSDNNHEPITEELIELLENNPKIEKMLEKSIVEARISNPDPKTNPVQNLSDYYNFIDRVSQLLPQDMIESTPGLSLRDQMLQGLCYCYYLVSQPLPELDDKGLFKNSLQYYEPFSSWLRHFAVTLGEYLDTEESWNEDVYQTIYNAPEFGLQKDWYESPSNWKTFNQFFARYLKSPDVRPIASPDDPSVVVSPADSVPQGVWKIDEYSDIQVEGGMKVKMLTYFSIQDLLGEDSKYKDAFANGVLTHTFLNVNDYHRYHFAVGGTIKEMAVLTRNVSLEVSWSDEESKYVPIDSTGWQFSQTLGYVIVDTGEYGLVALIPMGMAQVSSVNFEDYVEVGATVKKGDPLGNFLFGGSDFIMLFQEKAGFEITAPLETTSDFKHKNDETEYKHILVGEEYGTMKSTN